MNNKVRAFLGMVFGLAVLAVPALAHHSAAAEFDVDTPITLKGTITKIEWINPHIYIHMDVKDSSGAVTNWDLETGPPGMMHRAGLGKDSFGEGQAVTVYGYAAKDGTKHLGWMRKVTFQDGHTIEIWPENVSLAQQR